MTYTIILFILAGVAEIGGGYLVWLWLREGKPYWYEILGGIILALYGIIQPFKNSLHSVGCMRPMVECLLFFQIRGDGGSIRKHLILTIGLEQSSV